MTDVRTADDIASDMGVTSRWLRARVKELGVPHLALIRGRMGFTDDQHAALLAALTKGGQQPTSRSRARQRKGRAA